MKIPPRPYFFIILLGIVLLLCWRYPYAVRGTENQARLVYLVLLISMIASGSLWSRSNLNSARWMKYAATWIVAIMLLMMLYSYRGALLDNRFVADLIPNHAHIEADGSFSVKSASDGHFHIEGEINGVVLPFVVDTGASDIVLNPEDAKRVGIDVDTLAFTRSYHTANGISTGAVVRAPNLVIGPIRLTNVEMSVNSAPMEESLLGMSFLRQLTSYQVTGDTLTLKP